MSFSNYFFILDLLVNINELEIAKELIYIDSSICSNPNVLSDLAIKFLEKNDLDSAIFIYDKLKEIEPYHPSVDNISVLIERIRKRERLKTDLSLDFSKINELQGIEFENFLIDKFFEFGFKVELTPKIGDYGADIILENANGTKIIIQCKRFKSRVNLKAVQEVIGAIGHYCGDKGIVITNSTFLNSAIKLAESHDIELWDGDKLLSFLSGDISFSEINH
ncbi:restriction endonuclease [Methylicorpusculum sp.]|uniref:restriction endonuclease n=1 Tax=Methylicorpusculum sp. TaxID=2713644 RepID=UPI00271C68F2|nr:restriction endonuclease [Methylicorpusculum sp.]MDO8843042.1 restriction endonuclease [Methylicorpusculum sp.]